MTVAAILGEKGNNVLTASPSTTIEQIAKTLGSKKIGAIVIVDDGDKVCGIVSERDVVRHLANMGASVLDTEVSECMTHKVISCSQSDTVDDVMAQMTKNRFRHLPVIENGKLVGIISIGDVVKRKIEKAERDAEDLKKYIAG